MCLLNPEKYLFLTTSKDKVEIINILDHIKTLKYEDRPNYEFIQNKLKDMRNKEFARIFQKKFTNGLNNAFFNDFEKLQKYYDESNINLNYILNNVNINNQGNFQKNSKNLTNENLNNFNFNQNNNTNIDYNNYLNNGLFKKQDEKKQNNYNTNNLNKLKSLYLNQLELESHKRIKKDELLKINSFNDDYFNEQNINKKMNCEDNFINYNVDFENNILKNFESHKENIIDKEEDYTKKKRNRNISNKKNVNQINFKEISSKNDSNSFSNKIKGKKIHNEFSYVNTNVNENFNSFSHKNKLQNKNLTNIISNKNLSNIKQNQIFIINQINKNKMTHHDKELYNCFINEESKNHHSSKSIKNHSNSSVSNSSYIESKSYLNKNKNKNDNNDIENILSKFLEENLKKQYVENYTSNIISNYEQEKKNENALDNHILNLFLDDVRTKNSSKNIFENIKSNDNIDTSYLLSLILNIINENNHYLNSNIPDFLNNSNINNNFYDKNSHIKNKTDYINNFINICTNNNKIFSNMNNLFGKIKLDNQKVSDKIYSTKNGQFYNNFSKNNLMNLINKTPYNPKINYIKTQNLNNIDYNFLNNYGYNQHNYDFLCNNQLINLCKEINKSFDSDNKSQKNQKEF